jgi:hypothetical protein
MGNHTPAYYDKEHTAMCFPKDGVLYHLILCESAMGRPKYLKDPSQIIQSTEVYYFNNKIWWTNLSPLMNWTWST